MPHRPSRFLMRMLLTAALVPTAAVGALAGVAAHQGRSDSQMASLAPAFSPSHLAGGAGTSAPAGYLRFCAQSPQDCGGSGARVSLVRLDAQKEMELERVNRGVNARIDPVTDLDHYGETERWAYPDDGKGDCEDYVLEKRRTLLNLGWPSSVLLITVVRDRDGNGHAVLTVVTDRGDLILDNQEEEILSWQDNGYRYVKRQSQLSPSEWVSLGEMQGPPVVGAGR